MHLRRLLDLALAFLASAQRSTPEKTVASRSLYAETTRLRAAASARRQDRKTDAHLLDADADLDTSLHAMTGAPATLSSLAIRMSRTQRWAGTGGRPLFAPTADDIAARAAAMDGRWRA
jgi:hypothetical protein